MVGLELLDPGVSEAIRAAVPPWLVPAVAVLTELGNVALLLSVFALDYWFGDHERGAHGLSLLLAGMALVTGLKAIFAAPRPPESVRLVGTGGFSFPSGHATIATIGYGALATHVEVGPKRLRYAIAVVIVALVALSRVVLGVHFFRDAVAGVAVGLAFLLVAESLTGHRPRPGFLLAGAMGVFALAVSGFAHASVAEFGAIAGAAVAWEVAEPLPAMETTGERVLMLGVALPVFAVLSYLSLFRDLPAAMAFLVNAGLLVGAVLAPGVVARLTRSGGAASAGGE